MKLDEPIIELQFALTEIETRLMAYYPPVCKYDKQYKALNELRNRYINAIKLLEENNNTCINCDLARETYNICSDCLTKIINQNKK